jgi:hypothetical protein
MNEAGSGRVMCVRRCGAGVHFRDVLRVAVEVVQIVLWRGMS